MEIFVSDKIEIEMTDFLEKIKKDYNILFVLGASGIESETNYISIENLVEEEELDKITVLLGSYLDKEEIMLFRENLIYSFSLQSIIDNLSVLDANKVLFYAKNAVSFFERATLHVFIKCTSRNLYSHLFMVERLITKEPISSNHDGKEFELKNKNFINIAKKSFRNLCNHYGVELTTAEIQYLYEYIEDDRRKKKDE